MNTQKLGNDSGGFLSDDPEEPALEHPRPHVSVADSVSNDREDIQKYVEALKRRAQKSNCVGGSSTQDKSVIPRRPELWMLPVSVHSFHIVLMIE